MLPDFGNCCAPLEVQNPTSESPITNNSFQFGDVNIFAPLLDPLFGIAIPGASTPGKSRYWFYIQLDLRNFVFSGSYCARATTRERVVPLNAGVLAGAG